MVSVFQSVLQHSKTQLQLQTVGLHDAVQPSHGLFHAWQVPSSGASWEGYGSSEWGGDVGHLVVHGDEGQ